MANLFQGSDRDILNAIDIRVQMIRNRDALAAAGNLHPSLSTMESMVDPSNIEIDQAFTAIQNHVKVQLSRLRT